MKSSLMPKFFLGFDGGGTKTTCVLVDGRGRVLAEAVAGPSNPLRAGFRKAFAALDEAARSVCDFQYLERSQISGVCAGLAGTARLRESRRVRAFLERSFPKAIVRVTTDLEIALEAAAGRGQGIVIVAGTGSAAFGRNAAGRTARAGGHGPVTSDEGSAFHIGRQALGAVERARQRHGPPTLLSDRVARAFVGVDRKELAKRIARNPDGVYPRIFPLVAETADLGDHVARELLLAAAEDLSKLARRVLEDLHMEGRRCAIAMAGGVFGHSQFLDAALEARLKEIAPRARVRPLEISPAVAAGQLARRAFEEANGR
jgi:N-acetylglucosamine kinase-like BadF-type ATPase